MELQAYLDRIGFTGRPTPDAETLRRVHHLHLLGISYENVSVQLGEGGDLTAGSAYRKIVEGGRGGWCYEMNGLLQWALEAIGFDVTRVAAGVMRSERGDRAIGNHLVLCVRLEGEPWLADVGFGDGLREPVPLWEGPIEQGGLTYGLSRQPDGFWRLANHRFGSARDFDFRLEAADEGLLAAQCRWLQDSPESGFVQSLVCQRFERDAIQLLRGRVRRTVTRTGVEEWRLETRDQLDAELRSVFGLTVDVGRLWPKVARRHEELFGATGA